MLQIPWHQPTLTKEQADDLFMLTLEGDGEGTPWLGLGDLEFLSASSFVHSLRGYARAAGLGWYVTCMLPIAYNRQNSSRKVHLVPDVFVAFAPLRPRTSYDAAVEGGFPPFVLEVVSPETSERDCHDRRAIYDLSGASEYALFTPNQDAGSMLDGFRRGATGQFEAWQPDGQGRLWSEVLGLYLVVRGTLLQAQTPEGRLLLTPEQTGAALIQADEARRRAEAEAEQLRRELERYRSRSDE